MITGLAVAWPVGRQVLSRLAQASPLDVPHHEPSAPPLSLLLPPPPS